MRYTSDVGKKFYTDGAVRSFPGNSIICPIDSDSIVFEPTVWLQAQLAQQSFSYKYVLLPSDSFHMTVIDLICAQVQKKENWSRLLPLDSPLDYVDRFFIERVSNVPCPSNFSMQYKNISPRGTSIVLSPASDETGTSLREYRDTIADVTGVRHPGHHLYQFHIS